MLNSNALNQFLNFTIKMKFGGHVKLWEINLKLRERYNCHPGALTHGLLEIRFWFRLYPQTFELPNQAKNKNEVILNQILKNHFLKS